MKKTFKGDIHVEVEINRKYRSNVSEKTELAELREIVSDIERHVDNVGRVDITWTDVEECEYCHYGWEEPPFCCKKAMREWSKLYPDDYSEDDLYPLTEQTA